MGKLFLTVFGVIALAIAALVSLTDRQAVRQAEEEQLFHQREARQKQMEWEAYLEGRVKEFERKTADESEGVKYGE
jgi:hypothetical protein